MKAKFVNEGFVLKPKSEDEIVNVLSSLSQDELNYKLLDASRDGQLSIVKMLLDAGADVNALNKYGDTPLLWASYNGHNEVVKLLLIAGADANIKNKMGTSALIYASRRNYKEMLKLLKKYGAKE